MILLVDDERDLNCDIIARNGKVAIELLPKFSWDVVMLDHDLGQDVSGTDVVNFMMQNNIKPKIVYLISMNPVGRERMKNILLDNGYVYEYKKGRFVYESDS